MTNGGNDPVRPEGGSASLQRRANLKALIANAPRTAVGSPAPNAHIDPPLVPLGVDGAATHNAIGAAMPGGRASGYNHPTFNIQTGSGVTAIGTPAGNSAGINSHRGPVPLNAGPAPHATGLNGTTMGHIASGPGTIGGPAKDRSGISGTSIRPKH